MTKTILYVLFSLLSVCFKSYAIYHSPQQHFSSIKYIVHTSPQIVITKEDQYIYLDNLQDKFIELDVPLYKNTILDKALYIDLNMTEERTLSAIKESFKGVKIDVIYETK